MAARRALKSIDWAGIAERLHPQDKAMYMAFKSKIDMQLRKVQENPEQSPAIDWSAYSKQVRVAGMVDNFKKQYEALSVPYPKDSYTELVDAQTKAIEPQIKAFVDHSNKEIAEAKKKIDEIKGLLPFADMTMEDVYDLYPEHAIDAINRPTIWPHKPEDQVDEPQDEHH